MINRFLKKNQAMTLLEVIIVIALIAATMVYVMPNLAINNNTTSTINMIKSEIKSVFDSTVLSGVPHRMGFYVRQRLITIEKIVDYDPTVGFFVRHTEMDQSLEKEKQIRQEKLEKLVNSVKDSSRPEVSDVENDRIIQPESPLLLAKSFLVPQIWHRVDEFGHKSIKYDERLVITKFYVEHLQRELTLDDFDDQSDDSVFYLYFYPRGYVQKSYIVFRELDDDLQIMQDLSPMIIITNPYQGTTSLSSDEQDANINNIDNIIDNNNINF